MEVCETVEALVATRLKTVVAALSRVTIVDIYKKIRSGKIYAKLHLHSSKYAKL